MHAFIRSLMLVVFSCAVGLVLTSPVDAAGTELPIVVDPDACAMMGRQAGAPCQRWYSLTEKPNPDACLDRPGAAPCSRWFSIAPIPEMIALRGVKFDFDSAKLKPESHQILDREVQTLQKHADADVTIVGHTSSEGEQAHNQKLSVERADAVKAYFVEKGISPSRLVTKGVGEANPVADNSTEAGREQNRRTDLLLN